MEDDVGEVIISSDGAISSTNVRYYGCIIFDYLIKDIQEEKDRCIFEQLELIVKNV